MSTLLLLEQGMNFKQTFVSSWQNRQKAPAKGRAVHSGNILPNHSRCCQWWRKRYFLVRFSSFAFTFFWLSTPFATLGFGSRANKRIGTLGHTHIDSVDVTWSLVHRVGIGEPKCEITVAYIHPQSQRGVETILTFFAYHSSTFGPPVLPEKLAPC